VFEDRGEAGRELAKKLAALRLRDPLVLALPRGGVPVGLEVAAFLGAPLEAFVVRKLGVPGHEEFGFGAVAQDGTTVVDQAVVAELGISAEQVSGVIRREKAEVHRRVKLYRGGRRGLMLARKNVVVVDDGLATGVSMRVAVEAVLKQRPKRLVVAVPVGSGDAVSSLRERLRPADEVVCLDTPENFSAVGMWYRHFPQVTDEEVVRVLEEARARFRAGKV